MSRSPKTSAILVAGGIGSRMQSHEPKQFLTLKDKAIVRYSFDLFMQSPEIDEVIVVCNPAYEAQFPLVDHKKAVRFAMPGDRRQDSVFNGLKATLPETELILIHDSARPFIDRHLIQKVLAAGNEWGAATLGLPVKFTVKMTDSSHFVSNTLDRSLLWEIQTPQVVKREILEEGFRVAIDKGITVTDDVSLAELIGAQVKLVEGCQTNIKITVPADLDFANHLLSINHDFCKSKL